MRLPIAVARRAGRDNLSMLAAGVAFYAFVGIPSGLTAIVSVYGLIFDRADVERHLGMLADILPSDAINVLWSFLGMLAATPEATLSLHFFAGLFVALWSAQSAAGSMIVALNAIYDKDETRSYLRYQLSAFLLAACSIVFTFLSLCLSTIFSIVLASLPLTDGTRDAIGAARWLLLAVMVAAAISGVYRFAPARSTAQQSWGIWGVGLTTIVWIGSSALFALYATNIASYDASYGSLGAIVVLLLWIYLAIFIVLLGAELNAELIDRAKPLPIANAHR